jgi:hypothetical protein
MWQIWLHVLQYLVELELQNPPVLRQMRSGNPESPGQSEPELRKATSPLQTICYQVSTEILLPARQAG